MNTQSIPSVRQDRKHGWYVPQVNGVDLPITTFDEERAWEIANAHVDPLDRVERTESWGFRHGSHNSIVYASTR